MVDTKIEENLREVQGNRIRKTKGNVTFSDVVNDALKKGLDR